MKFLTTLLYSLTLIAITAWGMSIELPEGAVNAQMVVQGYEWGPAVPKVIVEFEDFVIGFTKDTFNVKTGGVEREVTDVYNCDENGVK